MRTPELPPRLESKRFVLRDFTETDRASFVKYRMDSRYRALHGQDSSKKTRLSTNALFDRFLAWQHDVPRRNYLIGIFDKSTGALVGCTGLRGDGLPIDTAVFSVELAPDHWPHYRIAVEASMMLVSYGFRVLDLAAIVGDTASSHKRITKLARWFGAEITAEHTDAYWMETPDTNSPLPAFDQNIHTINTPATNPPCKDLCQEA
ncbi:GNAT family protein [Thalassospira alkalitolerans]|uniref:GNAT family N-acetyltransferase n=1 Tax=Thalassospira alkalitolerans TaxID=1293890 RepID=UPI0030EDD2A4|tara:strand:- start:48709 stop:49323 length:615 start_codon:yes stop_codon:yes gene_type:complete